MATMNENEKNALLEKLDNPEKRVICPRCGNEIQYEKCGNSEEVECKTPGCLYSAIRGI